MGSVENNHKKFNQSDPPRDVNENVDTEPIGDLGIRKKQWEEFMIVTMAEQTTPTKISRKLNGPSHLQSPPSLDVQDGNNGIDSGQQYIEVKTPTITEAVPDNTNNGNGNIIQREIREQQRREKALRSEREKTLLQKINGTTTSTGNWQSPPIQVNKNMSVLELEIKLQQERELETAKQRELVRQISPTVSSGRSTASQSPNGIRSPTSVGQNQVQSPLSSSQRVQSPPSSGQRVKSPPSSGQRVQSPPSSGQRVQSPPSSGQRVQSLPSSGQRVQSPPSNGQSRTGRKYPEMHTSPSIESIIRQEMEELKMRENELQNERKALGLNRSIHGEPSKDSDYLKDDVHINPPRPRPPTNLNNDFKVSLRGRTVSAPSTPVTPVAPTDDTDSSVKHENAVEKERRISVHRDAEYRRLRGLSVPLPPRTVQLEVRKSSGIRKPHAPVRKISMEATEGSKLRNLASSRLQMEIEREQQRELDLKKEGKIRTTSEDHIGEPILQAGANTSTPESADLTSMTELKESLIELEIKQQKQREEEIRKLRKKAGSP